MSRTVRRPADVDPCECGSGLAELTLDGITHRYDCLCGKLLADFARKATP